MSIEATKKDIRAVIAACGLKTAYKIKNLRDDYNDIMASSIPLHGYRNLMELLASMTDTVIVYGEGPNATIQLCSSGESSHMENLILGTPRARNKGSRSGRSRSFAHPSLKPLPKKDRVPNAEVLRRMDTEAELLLTFFGHVTRNKNYRLLHVIVQEKIEGLAEKVEAVVRQEPVPMSPLPPLLSRNSGQCSRGNSTNGWGRNETHCQTRTSRPTSSSFAQDCHQQITAQSTSSIIPDSWKRRLACLTRQCGDKTNHFPVNDDSQKLSSPHSSSRFNHEPSTSAKNYRSQGQACFPNVSNTYEEENTPSTSAKNYESQRLTRYPSASKTFDEENTPSTSANNYESQGLAHCQSSSKRFEQKPSSRIQASAANNSKVASNGDIASNHIGASVNSRHADCFNVTAPPLPAIHHGTELAVNNVPSRAIKKTDYFLPNLDDKDLQRINKESIIPEKVQMRIIQIAKNHPNGLYLTNLLTVYNRYFDRSLRIKDYGFSDMIFFVEELRNILRTWRLDRNGDWMLYYTGFDVGEVEAILRKVRNQERQIPSDIIRNIRILLQSADSGVSVDDFERLYEISFERLHYEQYGYYDKNDFLSSLENMEGSIVKRERIDGRGVVLKYQIPRAIEYVDSIVPGPLSRFDSILKKYFSDDIVGPSDDLPKLDVRQVAVINDSLDVNVGEVISPRKFYLQPRIDGGELDELMDNLDDFYKSYSGSDELLYPSCAAVPGVVCASYYKTYGWHRIRIDQINAAGGAVRAYYVDYGSYWSLKKSSLRKLPKRFAKLREQAFRAKLAYIKPLPSGSWSAEAKVFFLELTKNRDVRAYVLDIDDMTDEVTVSMTYREKGEEIDMATRLVAKGYAQLDIDTEESLVEMESPHSRLETTEDLSDLDEPLFKDICELIEWPASSSEVNENKVKKTCDAANEPKITPLTVKVEDFEKLHLNSSTPSNCSPFNPLDEDCKPVSIDMFETIHRATESPDISNSRTFTPLPRASTTCDVLRPPPGFKEKPTVPALTASQRNLIAEYYKSLAYQMETQQPIFHQPPYHQTNYSQLPYPFSGYQPPNYQPPNYPQLPYPQSPYPQQQYLPGYPYNIAPYLPPHPYYYAGAPACYAPTSPALPPGLAALHSQSHVPNNYAPQQVYGYTQPAPMPNYDLAASATRHYSPPLPFERSAPVGSSFPSPPLFSEKRHTLPTVTLINVENEHFNIVKFKGVSYMLLDEILTCSQLTTSSGASLPKRLVGDVFQFTPSNAPELYSFLKDDKILNSLPANEDGGLDFISLNNFLDGIESLDDANTPFLMKLTERLMELYQK